MFPFLSGFPDFCQLIRTPESGKSRNEVFVAFNSKCVVFELRKRSEAMHGWAKFANPSDCAETYEEMKKNPKNGIKVEKDGADKASRVLGKLETKWVAASHKETWVIDFTQNLNVEN